MMMYSEKGHEKKMYRLRRQDDVKVSHAHVHTITLHENREQSFLRLEDMPWNMQGIL